MTALKFNSNITRILAFALTLFLFIQSSNCQQISYSSSEPYKTIDAPLKYYLVKDNILLMVKIDKRITYFQKFDINNLEPIGSSQSDHSPATEEVEYIGKVGMEYYLFFTKKDEDEIEKLYMWQIDFGKNTYNGEPKYLPKVTGDINRSSLEHIILSIDTLKWDSDGKSKIFPSLITHDSLRNAQPENITADLIGYHLRKKIRAEEGDVYQNGDNYWDMPKFKIRGSYQDNYPDYKDFKNLFKSSNELKLRGVHEDEDGEIIIIKEEYKQEKSKGFSTSPTPGFPPSGSSQMYSETTYFKNLILSKFDSLGKPQWTKIIPKKQTLNSSSIYALNRGVGQKTFKYLRLRDKHLLIFLDSPNNITKSIEEKPSRYEIGSQGSLMLYSVDDLTGETKKLFLFNTNSYFGYKLYQLTPQRIVKTNDNCLILEAYKKKNEDILIKIKIK